MKFLSGRSMTNYLPHGIDRRLKAVHACVLVLLILPSTVFGQDAKLPATKRTLLENAISKFMAANRVPGISAAVVWNGEEVWSEGFGMADLENSVPVTPQTLFRLASISKPITATAAMAALGAREA